MLYIYVLEYLVGVFIALNPESGIEIIESGDSNIKEFTKRILMDDGEYSITHFYINGEWVEYNEAIQNCLVTGYQIKRNEA